MRNHEKGIVDKTTLQSKETELIEEISKTSNFSRFTELTWHDIQTYLKEDDAIIEFYENTQHEQPELYAVILTASSKPKVISCYKKQDEKNLIEENKITSSIWDAIGNSLINKKRIFFSPSGHLYNYPLESEIVLSHPHLKFYRLTSSRELTKIKNIKHTNASVYGGLNFDMSMKHLKEEPHIPQNDNDTITRGNIPTLDILPGTLKEAKSINRELKKKKPKIKVRLYMSNKGTENSFKKLSGMKQNIIHIGTHGFFEELPEQLELSTNSGKTYIKQNQKFNPLRYSGLYFSGANNHIETERLDFSEDGILTAQEICNLDFRELDLISLSACQTGLGEITSDGVFGLQRAFKKAGVNSILMSLWNVDDNATCLLMTEFYKNWMEGKTKHEALELAKEAVRSQEKWKEPKFWAAFILLDALD